MFRKKFRQIHSLFVIFLLLFQNTAPLFLFPKVAQAQAVTDLTTPITEQVEQQVIETEAATFEEIASNEIGEEVDESAEETEKTSEQETAEEAPTPQPSRQLIEAVTLKEPSEDEVETEISATSPWTQEGDIYTISQVELGKTYSAPQNDQVTITFTKLPENPGSLSVEEVILSDEQVEALRALSNVAYDITSDMENGSFEYDLKLPLPEGLDSSASVIFAETVEQLTSQAAQTVATEKVDIDQEAVIVSIDELDHFTVFVVVPDDIISSNLLSILQQGWRLTSTGNAAVGLVDAVVASVPNDFGPHVIKMNRNSAIFGSNRSYLGYYQLGKNLSDIEEIKWNRYTKVGTDTYLNIFLRRNALSTDTATVVYQPGVVANTWQEQSFNSSSTGIQIRVNGGAAQNISWTDLMNTYGSWNITNDCAALLGLACLLPNNEVHIGGIVIVSGSSTPNSTQEHYVDGITIDFAGSGAEYFDFVNEVPIGPEPDTQSPSVPINPNLNGAIINTNNFDFDWDDSTDESLPITYEFQSSLNPAQVDGVLTGPVLWKSGILPTSMIYSSGAPDGVWYWQVRAIDAVGNVSDWSEIWTVELDHSKPTVDLVFPVPGPTSKSFQAVFSEKVNPAEATNPANYFLINWPGFGGSGDLAGDATIVYDEPTKTATITFIHSDWYISPEQLWGVENIRDLAGNLLLESPYQEHSTPMVAPVTTDSGTDANWHNSPVTVTLTCTDVDGSGCKNTYYTTDSSEPTTSSTQGNSVVLNSDGTYTIKYFSTDNAGNVESVKTAANQVKIDMTAPDAPNLVSPANGAVVNGSLLTNDWSDVADAHHYVYESYHDAAGENLRWHEEFTASQKSATNVANTTFWWRVKAVDHAGNQSPWSELWKVTVDNDAPVVFLTAPTNSILSGTVTIRGTITDANPHHYWFVIQNSSNTQVAGPGTVNDSTSFTDKLLLNWDTNSVPDGTYTIKLEARDSANNKNENKDIPGSSVVWKTVTVDNTLPSSIITSYGLGNGGTVATNTFSGLIEGTASDNLSGVSKVLLSISHLGFGQDESETKYWDATGSAWVDTQSIFDANGTTNWNYQLPEGEVLEGFYTITSHAVDNAGNVESTYQIKIVYDKTIPEVALTINPASPDGDNGWYRYTKPTITLTASDNHSLDHLEFQWNTTGGTWITYTGPIQPPGEGQNILYYRAIDQVGNIFGPGVKEVKYDTTNPAGEPRDLRVENVTADTADAFWKAPENDSDVARYLVSWRHENGAQYGAETGRDDFDHKLTNLFDGLWTLTVKAVDHAGNFTQSQINFRVGPGPSSGGDGSVLGATTDDTSPLAATSVFGQTSGSIPADTDQANATSGDSTNPAANVNENNGDVLGTTSCSPWQNYLPIALLAIQLLILLAWEVMSKEAGVSKVLPSIVITAGIAAAYYWLRNAECFTQGSGLAMIDKWFIVMALVTGLAAKLVGKALFEEK